MRKARIAVVLFLGIFLVSGLACGLLDSTTVRVFEGISMEPNIYSGQICTIDENAYSKVSPFRGDLIMFDSPQATDRTLIKRVIALPGEKVEIKDGQVYITDINDNTFSLDEPYIMEEPNYNYSLRVVPEDEYFVLGDKRNHSTDSHVWGMLPSENIIGKVLHCEFKQASGGDLSLGESAVKSGTSFTVVEYKLSESISCQQSDLLETEYPPEWATFLWLYMRVENVRDTIAPFYQPNVYIDYYEEPRRLDRWLGACDNIDIPDTTNILEPGESTEGWQIFYAPKGLDISKVRVCIKAGEAPCWKLTQ